MRRFLPYLFVGSLFLALTFNTLLTTGMFMDGLIYSSIAKNLSLGIGSFWHPQYTETVAHEFYGHPPLMMALLSVWMKIMGCSMLSAKMYSVVVMLFSAAGLIGIWHRLGFSKSEGWLPLLMCLLIPQVVNNINQNFLESTMLIFVVASVWAVLCGGLWRMLLSGAMLSLAFLTKGPTGLFPLAMPMLVWIFSLRPSSPWLALRDTLLMLLGLLLPLSLLWFFWSDAHLFLTHYFEEQLLGSLGVSTHSRWYVLSVFFSRTAVPLSLALLAIVFHFFLCRKSPLLESRHLRTAGAMFALSLCGTLPMMLSTKLYAHYLLCAFPFVALSSAVLFEPFARRFDAPLHSRLALIITAIVFALGIVLNATHSGRPGRDKEILSDLSQISPLLEEGETLTIPDPLVFQYNLHGYYYFYRSVSLDQHHAHRHLLTRTDIGPAEWADSYTEIPLNTKQWKLYEKL